MSEQINQLFEMILTLDRKFTTFAQAAGYEFDEIGNAKRVSKPASVPAIVDKPKAKRFNFKQSLIDAGACPEDAELYVDVRKKKKAVNSELAYKQFIGSLGCYTVQQAVKICAGEQWKGFKVEWAENLKPDIKKRYSIFELASGAHVEQVAANNPQLVQSVPNYAAQFDALRLEDNGAK